MFCNRENPNPWEGRAVAMANVGKRTRSGLPILEEPKWCVSLTPGQQLQQYGRSICFRVAHESTNNYDFYCIPFDFGDDSDSHPKNQKNVEQPIGILPFKENCEIPWSSTFAAVGSTLFCFGGEKEVPDSRKPFHRFYYLGWEKDSTTTIPWSNVCYRYDDFDTICDIGGRMNPRGHWYTHSSFDMIRARWKPVIIPLRGKLLIIGGIGENVEDGSSWAEEFDPYTYSFSPVASFPNELLDSPALVTAVLRSSNQILVASIFTNAAYVCDGTTLAWDIFDQSDQFVFGKGGTVNNFELVKGEAAVVRDTILCWFHFSGNLLFAYDLKLKLWFTEPIIGLRKVGKLIEDLGYNDFSLLPLDYDHICLLWFHPSSSCAPYGDFPSSIASKF